MFKNICLFLCYSQTLGNGTLYFPPFRAQDYRKDIHKTVYQCRAANQGGTILSRDVAVQASKSKKKFVFICSLRYFLDVFLSSFRCMDKTLFTALSHYILLTLHTSFRYLLIYSIP